MTRYEKILGCLAGAAIGDAMGAATEIRTTEQIRERFGGYVIKMVDPPGDTFARNRKAGAITDDFSQAYYIVNEIIRRNGEIDEEIGKAAILRWWDDGIYNCFAGPTTRASIQRLKGISAEDEYTWILQNNSSATNGSAMKIGPVGLFTPEDQDRAIENAYLICRATHNNNLSISGAAAVAAAVSAAMSSEANIYSIVQAGLYGAREGFKIGSQKATNLAGPSVERRIELAVDIAIKSKDLADAMLTISDIVGTGLHISEAVPAVFGILVAAKGDFKDALFCAVNIGGDTDTIATMTGAIAGTLRGVGAIDPGQIDLINRVNEISLEETARKIEGLL